MSTSLFNLAKKKEAEKNLNKTQVKTGQTTLRAPSEPDGLASFKKTVEDVSAMCKMSGSIKPMAAVVDSLISISSSMIMVGEIRMNKVESLLPSVDTSISTANAAFSAMSAPPVSVAGMFTYSGKKNKANEAVFIMNGLVASNMKDLASARSMLNESHSDLIEINSIRSSIGADYTSSLADSVKASAISIFWKKCEIDQQLLSMNASLSAVETNIQKINEKANEIILIENDVNGDKSILSKSVNACISASLENDKKAAKEKEDKQLFDMYMQFCDQSPLGGFLAKTVANIYSSGEILPPPKSYENVQIVTGRAPSASILVKKFVTDLYYNFLNSYESLTPEQMYVISALSGGAVTLEMLIDAKLKNLKKIVDDSDKVPVSASNSHNPLTRKPIHPKNLNRDLLIVNTSIPTSATDEEKRKAAEAIALAEKRIQEEAALAEEARKSAEKSAAMAADLQAKFDEAQRQLAINNDQLAAAELKVKLDNEQRQITINNEAAMAAELQAKFEEAQRQIAINNDLLAAEKLAAAESKAKADSEESQKKYEKSLADIAAAANEKEKKIAEDAAKKHADEMAKSDKEKEELKEKLANAIASAEDKINKNIEICAEWVDNKPPISVDLTSKVPANLTYPGSELPPWMKNMQTKLVEEKPGMSDGTKIAIAIGGVGLLAVLIARSGKN